MPTLSRRTFTTTLGAASAVALTPLAPALAGPSTTADGGAEDLRRMRVPRGADGPVWSPGPTGFAGVPTDALPGGAVGGRGGAVVVVRDPAALAETVLREGPTTVLVEGTLEITPFGTNLKVSSRTSILGVGRGAEIVGGGFHLDRVQDVVIRNLTFRDSYVPGDWDGKSEDNDNDGIRVDTSDHVWIDHCEFARLGDGLVDIRKGSTAVTVSWCVFRDHNKTLGVGWTDEVTTTLTLHHSRFSHTYQRNASIDNAAAAHVHSCLFQGQAQYGTMARGESGDAADVTLTYDLAAGTEKFYGGSFGATGAATLAVLADAVTLADLTIENAYDEAAHGGSQAQALRTVGDRIVLDGVRLLGNQDTFLAESPAKDVLSRVYVTGSTIEGDVDFIYGRATMVLEDSEIRSLDRGEANNGYVCAPSTAGGRRGLLFVGCRFTSGAAAGTVHLGRPWHPSSDPAVEPSAVIRESHLGAHIRTPAWSDMSGWPWREDFLREHANTGPGAAPAGEEDPDRPQLTAEEAALHTRETYLHGDDDWSPWS